MNSDRVFRSAQRDWETPPDDEYDPLEGKLVGVCPWCCATVIACEGGSDHGEDGLKMGPCGWSEDDTEDENRARYATL